MAKLISYVTVFLAAVGAARGLAQLAAKFERIDVPSDYWQEVTVDSVRAAAFNTKEMCTVSCIDHGSECMAYDYDAAAGVCTLGKVVSTWAANNYIPEYIEDRKTIMMRSDLIVHKAVANVTHLIRFDNDAGTPFDVPAQALEDPASPALYKGQNKVPMPVEGLATGYSSWAALLSYGRGFILCGGFIGSTSVKKCWTWSFRKRAWKEFPSEPTHFHLAGEGVVVGHKLYLFMGRNGYTASSAAHDYVDIYNFKTGTWTEDQERAPYTACDHTAVDLLNGKILIVGGRHGGAFRKNVAVYDTATGTYDTTNPGNIWTGTYWIGCVRTAEGDFVVCAGGYNAGYERRVKILNIATQSWLPDDATQSQPADNPTQLLNVNGNIYSLWYNKRVYKYLGPVAPCWEQVTGLTLPWYNWLLITMDYYELLI